ncbi:TraB/GumN family protein [Jiella sonneratiae]|uniref:TraB/GumN family protein n=1 Tax=Jiella sonneratiae TaxID=2816856 RepID=UPI001FD8D1A2|nr:TraB/GumN family protein [Jiella sonneratiae]
MGRLFRFIPHLAAGLVAAGLLSPSQGFAAPADCRGKSFVPALRADGRLAAVEAKAAAVPNGEGRFYRIEAAGAAPSFLLGTMHLGDPRLLRLPAPIREAFAQSRSLVIETTDILDQKKMAGALFADPALTTLPDGKTLDDYLTQAEREKLAATLSKKGVPLQAVERLQPWFLSSGFMLPDCQKQTIEAGVPLVLDTSLAGMAKAAQKPVEGLETALEQLQSMAAIPIKQQMDGFVALIAAEDELDDIFETMIELYLAGDVSTIVPAIEAAVPEGGMMVGTGEGYGAFEEKVITERNGRMAERLVPLLGKGGVFIAVGALHLPGEKGLVALLRRRGYAVTRIDLAAPAPPGKAVSDEAPEADAATPGPPKAAAPDSAPADAADTKK